MRRIGDAYAAESFTVDLEVSPSLPLAAITQDALETVLTTLVENSRQAGASRISLAAEAQGMVLSIVAADDGPGIAPADRARVFEPFFTTRRTCGGTGLGLPIARSLLQAHRGAIELLTGGDLKGATLIVSLQRSR